ncbi:MAG: heavy metal translocating P-type ATPase [Pseudomonadota bacterium]
MLDTRAGCCADGAVALAEAVDAPPGEPAVRLSLLVEGLRCGGCLATVERAAASVPGVLRARANLTERRLAVEVAKDGPDAEAVIAALAVAGYAARPLDRAALEALDRDAEGRGMLLRVGVAGFAAMNVMLLSVAIWAGAEGAMGRLLLLVSMVVSVPAVLWCGMPFFQSAWRALSARRLTMDVPISLAILLALGVSVHATLTGLGEGWFEAATALVFFLLAGRYLEHRAKRAARSAAVELAELRVATATRLVEDGREETVDVDALVPGDRVLVRPGERLPADGTVVDGSSDVDRALVTGEAVPETVRAGDDLLAGMTNLTAPLTVRLTAAGEDTYLAALARLVAAAEGGDGRTRRLADRAAAVYAPGVHVIAALATLAWLGAGAGWHTAILVGCATLIITCPCALGLAIPAVQTVAGGRLFRAGVYLKDGGALESLAEATVICFDKTGTLTEGRPALVDAPAAEDPAWGPAMALAAASSHPLAKALVAAGAERGLAVPPPAEASEEVGAGVEGTVDGRACRLGRPGWAGPDAIGEGAETTVWLSVDGEPRGAFRFRDRLRADAADVIAALAAAGCRPVLLSGDGPVPVRRVAEACGIAEAHAAMTPEAKRAFVERLRAAGETVAMVGDGYNDAPALAAADVALAPATAVGISEGQAGIVYAGAALGPVARARAIAVSARRRMVENLWASGAYNVIAVPVAVAGFATPIIAALAMSSSSLVVTVNALRLGAAGKGDAP